MVHRILSDHSLEHFVIGPTFCEKLRQLVTSHLAMSTMVLMDAVLASSMAWLDDMAEPHDCYRKASSALSNLSTIEVNDEVDASTCILLGALLHTFALKQRVDDIYIICTETLGRIKPIYESKQYADPTKLFMLTCLVLGEIFECLVRCKVPTLRYKPPADQAYVDRYVGLCGTLLPLLHDVCELNNSLFFADESDGVDILEALSSVERAVADWLPPIPDGFATSFTSVETAHMLCQAQIMKTATLLVIHRLRYPYGCADESALAMASTIMHQLDMTHHVTGKQVKCVDLAILVASFEFKSAERARWEQKLPSLLGYSLEYKRRVQDILKSVWAARDHGIVLYWCNLSEVIDGGSSLGLQLM